MKKFSIEASERSPRVVIDAVDGVLEITGNSTLKPAAEFYKQLERWIHAFNLSDPSTRTVNIQLQELDGQSSFWMLHVLQQLEKLYRDKNSNLVVNWYYKPGDRKILRAGMEYSMNVRIPFNILAA